MSVYTGESGELASSVSVTPGSAARYVPSLYETASDALRALANTCPATRYATTYATVVGTHDRSSVLWYGAVCFASITTSSSSSSSDQHVHGRAEKKGQQQTRKVTAVWAASAGGSGVAAGCSRTMAAGSLLHVVLAMAVPLAL